MICTSVRTRAAPPGSSIAGSTRACCTGAELSHRCGRSSPLRARWAFGPLLTSVGCNTPRALQGTTLTVHRATGGHNCVLMLPRRRRCTSPAADNHAQFGFGPDPAGPCSVGQKTETSPTAVPTSPDEGALASQPSQEEAPFHDAPGNGAMHETARAHWMISDRFPVNARPRGAGPSRASRLPPGRAPCRSTAAPASASRRRDTNLP